MLFILKKIPSHYLFVLIKQNWGNLQSFRQSPNAIHVKNRIILEFRIETNYLFTSWWSAEEILNRQVVSLNEIEFDSTLKIYSQFHEYFFSEIKHKINVFGFPYWERKETNRHQLFQVGTIIFMGTSIFMFLCSFIAVPPASFTFVYGDT